MNGDRSVLTELLLGFMYLTDEVDESLARLGDSLLGPISELELSHGARLAVLYTASNQ